VCQVGHLLKSLWNVNSVWRPVLLTYTPPNTAWQFVTRW